MLCGAPASIKRLVLLATRSASSPARSKFVIALDTAITKRRSRAVGWRRAITSVQAKSI